MCLGNHKKLGKARTHWFRGGMRRKEVEGKPELDRSKNYLTEILKIFSCKRFLLLLVSDFIVSSFWMVNGNCLYCIYCFEIRFSLWPNMLPIFMTIKSTGKARVFSITEGHNLMWMCVSIMSTLLFIFESFITSFIFDN